MIYKQSAFASAAQHTSPAHFLVEWQFKHLYMLDMGWMHVSC